MRGIFDKRTGGKIDFDFLKMVSDSKLSGMNLDLTVTRWSLSEVTELREPIAKNVKELYIEDKNSYNILVDLALKFEVKFYLEDLEEIGTLDGTWNNLFGYISEFDYILSRNRISIEEKIERIDKLLNRSNKTKLEFDNTRQMMNVSEIIVNLNELKLQNFEVPKIIFLSNLNKFDAIEIVKTMKEQYPNYELILDPNNVTSRTISAKELKEIIIICIKNGIPADISGDSQSNIKNVHKLIYEHLYRNGVYSTLKKHLDKLGNKFVYTEDLINFYSINIENHPTMDGYIISQRDINKEYLRQFNTNFVPQYAEKINNEEYFVRASNLTSNFSYIIHELFVSGSINDEDKLEYREINWSEFI